MRTSVLCNLALVVLAALVNARYTSSPPGASSEPETTPQLEAAARRPRGAEGAAGADALQGPWCPPCVQEALHALEWNAVTVLRDAARQLQKQLQLHDAAARALLEQMQRENDASHALLDERLQHMEETLQQKDQAMSALMDDRLKGVEERLRVLTEEMNLTAKRDEEMKPLVNQLDKRLMNLEANVQRVLQQLPSTQPNASTVTSSTACSPASALSSTSTSLPSSATTANLSSAPTSLPSSTLTSLLSAVSTSLLSSAPSAVPSSASTSFPSFSSISIPSSIPTSLPSSTAKSTPSPSRLGEELWRAAGEGSVDRVRSLLDAGADVNHRGDVGRSPLMEAHYRDGKKAPCNEAVVALLLRRGALVVAVDVYRRTPLHYAALFDTCARCVALLVGAGADVEASDKWRQTPLHLAAAEDNEAAVRLLLGAGADADARDDEGITPLHWAANYNKEANVRALLAAGARKDLRASSGSWKDETPFDLAESDAVRNLLRP